MRLGLVIVSAIVASSACTGVDAVDVGTRRQELASTNKLVFNKLVFNKLVFNKLVFNKLVFNKLSADGILADAENADALRDPDAREVLAYVVSCALAPGEVVEVPVGDATYLFEGEIGLAPEWATGSCGATCQRWITSCLLARVNADGIPVPISLRGAHASLALGATERARFYEQEGAYYGNLFSSAPELYACFGNDTSHLDVKRRTCRCDEDCTAMFIGPCYQRRPTAPTPPVDDRAKSCEGADSSVGSFFSCHGTSVPLAGDFPSGATTFDEVITVFTHVDDRRGEPPDTGHDPGELVWEDPCGLPQG